MLHVTAAKALSEYVKKTAANTKAMTGSMIVILFIWVYRNYGVAGAVSVDGAGVGVGVGAGSGADASVDGDADGAGSATGAGSGAGSEGAVVDSVDGVSTVGADVTVTEDASGDSVEPVEPVDTSVVVVVVAAA